MNRTNSRATGPWAARWFRRGLVVLILILPFYQPVRFLSGFVFEAPILLALWMAGLVLLSVWLLAKAPPRELSLLDVCMALFFLQSIFLAAICDSTLFERADGFRQFVLPPLLYLGASRAFNSRQADRAVWVFLVAALGVSLFFIEEFYQCNFNGKGYLGSRWMRLIEAHANREGHTISHSMVNVGSHTFIRIAGFIGHNHATAFLMTFGGVSAAFLALDPSTRRRPLALIASLTMATATAMSLARIAIAAGALTAGAFLAATRQVSRVCRYFIPLGLAAAMIFCAKLIFFSGSDVSDRVNHDFFGYQAIETLQAMLGTHDVVEILSRVEEHPLLIFTGAGFGISQSFPPVVSDDLHLIQLISAYGILGFGIFMLIVVQVCRSSVHCFTVRTENRAYCLVPGLYVAMILLTTLHSSTIIRVQLFPMIFVMAGLASAYQRELEITLAAKE